MHKEQQHTVKAYRGSGGNFGTTWKWAVSFAFEPPLPWRISSYLMGPLVGFRHIPEVIRKILPLLPGSESQLTTDQKNIILQCDQSQKKKTVKLQLITISDTIHCQ